MRTVILYEDDDIIVARKPAGLATQASGVGQADMVSELKNYVKDTSSYTGAPYIGVVHRLDQPVEGLLVFGKTKAAAASLTRQLESNILNKRYYAVVCGKPVLSEGELVDYLYKSKKNRAEIVAEDQAAALGAKRAVLRYRIAESVNAADISQREISLVIVSLNTGRFHQIRAQMANAGMPLLGDAKYGTMHSSDLSVSLHVRNVALCACELQFEHPATKQSMCFQIEPQEKIFSVFSNINHE